jgi:hypothetical protein
MGICEDSGKGTENGPILGKGLTDPDSSAMPKTKEPIHALDAVSNK